METENFREILSQPVNFRQDIYLAPKKIDTYFKDQGYLVSEFSQSLNEGIEAGASIIKILSFKVSGGIDTSEKVTLDTRDKVKVIDSISKENLVSMTLDQIKEKKRNLFTYNGPSHFIYWDEKIQLYNENENALINKEKERQEKILNHETVLFTFKINNIIYVSVADKENFHLGNLASCGILETHGILGIIERILSDNIVLINPFWIWYEN